MMSEYEIYLFLKQIPLFEGLSENIMYKLSHISRIRRYSRNEFISHQGDERNSVMFVHSGAAKVVHLGNDGEEFIYDFIGRGDVLPGTSFFSHTVMPASIRSLCHSVLVTVPQKQFENIVSNSPNTLRKIIKEMSRKLIQVQEWQQRMMNGTSYERMTSLLLRLAQIYGDEQQDGIHVNVPITQLDIAQTIGISRESVNRLFMSLRKEELVKRHGSDIILSTELYEGCISV